MPVACSIEGCYKQAQARGWCGKHYNRWQKYGDPTVVLKGNGNLDLLPYVDTDWIGQAACAELTTEESDRIFYPGSSGTGESSFQAAKEICAECPVAQQCLALALRNEGTCHISLRYGVFGGKTPADRDEIARADRNSVRKSLESEGLITHRPPSFPSHTTVA